MSRFLYSRRMSCSISSVDAWRFCCICCTAGMEGKTYSATQGSNRSDGNGRRPTFIFSYVDMSFSRLRLVCGRLTRSRGRNTLNGFVSLTDVGACGGNGDVSAALHVVERSVWTTKTRKNRGGVRASGSETWRRRMRGFCRSLRLLYQ